jgi:hypothetical protein
MRCNCGHALKRHEEGKYQCQDCLCPVVVWIVAKEVAEWRNACSKRATAPTGAEAVLQLKLSER